MARKGVLPEGVELVETMPNGKPRCLFVKKIGAQCKNEEIPGRARCKYHGGKAGRPPITGKFSKYSPVPTALVAKFQAAMEDPELLSLKKEVALVNSQVWDHVESRSKLKRFDEKSQKQLFSLLRMQQSLVKQESDREIALDQMLTMEQLLLLLSNITSIIFRRVADGPLRKQIAEDIRILIGTNVPRIVTDSVVDLPMKNAQITAPKPPSKNGTNHKSNGHQK